MWHTIARALLEFIQQWGDGAIFLIFLLEESGIPMPLPGDLVLIWAGTRVSSGQSQGLLVLLLVELATVIGASVLYWLAARGGRPLIERYRRFLHLDAAKLARAEAWMGRNATQAIILGRLMPGLRIVTPLAAGVFKVPSRIFLPALAIGALLYAAFWLALGVFFGPSIIAVLEGPRLTARLVISMVLLVGLGLLTWQVRRRVLPDARVTTNDLGRRRLLEAAVLAGVLATIEMATVLGIILILCIETRLELPEQTLRQAVTVVMTGRGTVLGRAFFPLAIAVFCTMSALWAVPYALWAEPRLPGPDWLKGATFALLPAAVSWLVILPLLGAGPFGLGLRAGLMPAAGELVRHLLYGVALGLAYPVLVLARRSEQPPGLTLNLGQPEDGAPLSGC
jgi:membrane protein DedA with SNARE-associated domain